MGNRLRSNGLKMQFNHIISPLIVIVGPTAVGKTEVSIKLAESFGGEIVSADSRLFYRGMDIGTAKPSPQERLRVPHHLIDIAEPDQTWSLALFQKAASDVIASIHSRGKLPFLVGGTGQYIRSVLEGWIPPLQQPDEALRKAIDKLGQEIGPTELHRRLSNIDPIAAKNMDPQNLRRTIRAFEVIFLTGKRFSVQRQQSGSPFTVKVIGLTRPREDLYKRIDIRIDSMITNGFVEEVSRLLGRGFSDKLPTLSAIGYREIIAYLRGEMTLDEASTQMKRLTRQFVRRQANWFKENDPNIFWFDMNKSNFQIIHDFIWSGAGWRNGV
jgi:tRNA dimethylallyltransferase